MTSHPADHASWADFAERVGLPAPQRDEGYAALTAAYGSRTVTTTPSSTSPRVWRCWRSTPSWRRPGPRWRLRCGTTTPSTMPSRAATNEERYEVAIRKEYRWVPGFLFRKKRREILQSFLDRPAIYGTEEFRKRFEAPARRNLEQAIAALR